MSILRCASHLPPRVCNTFSEIALLTFDDLAQWIHGGGHVAIFDATNTTRARRKLLIRKCCERGLPPPTFVETICTDAQVLEKNYRLKLRNADYKDKDPALALADFKDRVKEYEKVGTVRGYSQWKSASDILAFCVLSLCVESSFLVPHPSPMFPLRPRSLVLLV